jgi:hypothetical protein
MKNILLLEVKLIKNNKIYKKNKLFSKKGLAIQR